MLGSLNQKTSTFTRCARRADLRAGRRVAKISVSPRAQASAASSAWGAWDSFMQRRAKAAPAQETSEESKALKDLGSMISKSAVGFKPRFTGPAPEASAAFKLAHIDNKKLALKELPKDLHEKLEAIGVATLKTALNLEGELDVLNVSHTTTDIDAALSITGTQVIQGSDKSAVLVFVATETEREASWSRLEGLILHWACTASAGGGWAMPPEGWNAVPSKTRDAGGAIQASFEKRMIGKESVYVLVLQLPLRGILRSGGLVFVLKATANQADKWLKDAATEADFFLDLQRMPATKL